MRGEVVEVCSCVVPYSSVEARVRHFTVDAVQVLCLHNYSLPVCVFQLVSECSVTVTVNRHLSL